MPIAFKIIEAVIYIGGVFTILKIANASLVDSLIITGIISIISAIQYAQGRIKSDGK